MPEASDELMRVLREVLAPMVRADGGELYLVKLEGHLVELHLRGRFSGCPGNTLVVRRIIEPLVSSVLPDARVQISSGYLLPPDARQIEPELVMAPGVPA